jgi:hypothetical protein
VKANSISASTHSNAMLEAAKILSVKLELPINVNVSQPPYLISMTGGKYRDENCWD